MAKEELTKTAIYLLIIAVIGGALGSIMSNAMFYYLENKTSTALYTFLSEVMLFILFILILAKWAHKMK